MNLFIESIDSNIQCGNSFTEDKYKNLKADYILANPPFNGKDWKADKLQEDIRWKYGIPPVRNANFAWVQHFIHHLSPTGIAGFVLANGSMSAGGMEGKIRKNIIQADLMDCIVALPSQLFYNTGIPACLWFVTRDKTNGSRDRSGEVLFIDARNMGYKPSKIHRELYDEDIQKIAQVYHAWRGEGGEYKNIRGFCKSVGLEKIQKHGYLLTPGRYIEEIFKDEDNEELNFEDKLKEVIDNAIKCHNLANFDGIINYVMLRIYPNSEKKSFKIDPSMYDRVKLEVTVKELHLKNRKLTDVVNYLDSKVELSQIYIKGKHTKGIKFRENKNLKKLSEYNIDDLRAKIKELDEQNRILAIYGKKLYIRLQVGFFFLYHDSHYFNEVVPELLNTLENE